jgi:hypothetical protein
MRQHPSKGVDMTRASASKPNGAARPIKTKKDYSSAATLVERLNGDPARETAAEKRLQSLLKEMEKFDGDGEEDDENAETGYAGPRRRWSDESGDPD